MQIDRASNTIVRIWATYTNSTGNASNPDTTANITIYPANSSTPKVATTPMTNFATGIYFYAFDTTSVSLGQFSVRFTFEDAGVKQEYMENMDLTDSSRVGGGSLPVVFISKDFNGIPLSGTSCYCSSDIAGSNIITQTLVTDSTGKVTFFLNAGTYYLWVFRNGNTWQNPMTIAVV